MKITRIEAIPVNVPFKRPFVVWRGKVETKDHVIALVETDEGVTGLGEASPFLYYAPETQHDVVSTLENYFPALLIGEDPFDLERLGAMLDQNVDGHHFSKAAIEMALWDIIGQKLGQPLYRLLGGQCRPSVPVAVVLHSGEPAEMAREACEWVASGFKHLKIKIGFEINLDVARVEAVRQAVGEGISIRVDAEESYDLKGALGAARRLEKVGLELFSQPIPRHNHDDMAILRRLIDIPLLLDESIITPQDVLTAVKLGTGDLINIKVVKSGGILNAKRMAAIARAADKACLVGSMLEMGPGTVFAGHFALSTANTTYPCELFGPLLLADDVIKEPVVYADGALHLPDAPGLGVELDWEKVKRYSPRPVSQ